MDGRGAGNQNLHSGGRDDLYAQLWHECAGPSAYVPRVGEKVYYFPQGHLEQVAAFTNPDDYMEMPVYHLPFKILCRVISVQLKAEAYSDEVFAQITLIPEPKQNELGAEEEGIRQLTSRITACSFNKTLTPSDTSKHGGFSIPKRQADQCFPPLDMSLQTPTQELVARDLHGIEWHFRHIYRGQPKRHLLTSGWSIFLHSKKLAAGDAFIFLRGENGELRVGIRRAMKQQNNVSTASLISGRSMQLGILTSAAHAVATGTMFTVFFHPWTDPTEFIIPVDQYMKSTQIDYAVGLRVQMRSGAGESTSRRYAGTIIGKDDIDGIRWPGSAWRCLKVQWDAVPDTYPHPERVCPWCIEPLESSKRKIIPNLPPSKRAHLPDPSVSEFFANTKDDVVQDSIQLAPQERDLQDQKDYNVCFPQLAEKPPVLTCKVKTDKLHPPNITSCDSQLDMENPLHLSMQNHLCQSFGSSISFPGPCNSVSVNKDISTSNVNSSSSEFHGWLASESRNEYELPFGQTYSTYKLFGVNLINSHPELPSPQFTPFSKNASVPVVPPMSQSSISPTIPVSKPCNGNSGVNPKKKCKKCFSICTRSCTKVLKHGTALGRSVDLGRFAGYYELLSELDSMFDFKGSLIDGSSGWHVTWTDDDGDMMLLGDFPWQNFQSSVQKMTIGPKEDIGWLNPISN